MSRSLVLALLLGALVAPACRTTITQDQHRQVDRGSRMSRQLRAYHAVNAAHAGHVGFLKVFDVTEQGGPTFTWKYVYDTDFEEVGFVDQNGTAYRHHVLRGIQQEAMGRESRLERLPTDSLQRNVMRLLGIDPALDDVKFPVVSQSDIAGL